MPGSVRRTRRSGPTPGPPPFALSARLRLPLGRPNHEVSPIPPAQYGHAPLVWQADSCRRDDRAGEPMVKSVGVSRGGTSAHVRFVSKAQTRDPAVRREVPERTSATLALATRYDAISGLRECVGDQPGDRALGRCPAEIGGGFAAHTAVCAERE